MGSHLAPVVVLDTENAVGPSFELVDLNNDGLR